MGATDADPAVNVIGDSASHAAGIDGNEEIEGDGREELAKADADSDDANSDRDTVDEAKRPRLNAGTSNASADEVAVNDDADASISHGVPANDKRVPSDANEVQSASTAVGEMRNEDDVHAAAGGGSGADHIAEPADSGPLVPVEWVHIICAVYVPEVYVGSVEKMAPVHVSWRRKKSEPVA